jgi:hypothetical protein
MGIKSFSTFITVNKVLGLNFFNLLKAQNSAFLDNPLISFWGWGGGWNELLSTFRNFDLNARH